MLTLLAHSQLINHLGKPMNRLAIFVFAGALIAGAGCTPVSTATPFGPDSRAAWTGPVFISEAGTLGDIAHEPIGRIEVRARSGYNGSRNLYPQLADEARRLGANAVIGVRGGRRVAGWSWAAPYTEGVAVKVENPDALKGFSGSLY
jgi:hypothetical protein